MPDPSANAPAPTVEMERLIAEARNEARQPYKRKCAEDWKRWGPYLSERQWSTVREDYSDNGDSWGYFPHEHARSRAYRWGEDGLLGFADRQCRLCFALALWNERDPILKERLFGLTGPEGNHGEDVKECYYYLNSTPTHSYVRGLYKYPQAEFPYSRLVTENSEARRGLNDPEFELEDTGVFDENRYFDVYTEYAKATAEDILIKVTVANRGPEAAPLHVLPTLWLRNTWDWGSTLEECTLKLEMVVQEDGSIRVPCPGLGEFRFHADPANREAAPDSPGAGEGLTRILCTENESNHERLFGSPNRTPYVKDAFHECVVHGRGDAVNPEGRGSKMAPHYFCKLEPGQEVALRFRLYREDEVKPPEQEKLFGAHFEAIFDERKSEADEFYRAQLPGDLTPEERNVADQSFAGLLCSKQFYSYIVEEWLKGDAGNSPPPASRLHGRNHSWKHLYCHDILSMPDQWEYPWFAAWDTAFHMLPFAQVDPWFAKNQLKLFLREWYMKANGQLPAYEFCLDDVNPPVHAWAAWRVYKITGARGYRDRAFLESVFQKLLLNFTWWVNRKDPQGDNIFSGGFLGLDNIGVFDRSKPLPTGGHLEQADGTAWMAFYCLTMLSISLELAQENPVYGDLASKFFEHFVEIADAINEFGGSGLWDEGDGFYYDQLRLHDTQVPLRTRSLVGLIPLIAVEVLEEEKINALPEFAKRMRWFTNRRLDLFGPKSAAFCSGCGDKRLLAIPNRERLQRTLQYMLDENEFLSPHGIRSLSRIHASAPYVYHVGQQEYRVDYVPGESDSHLFGGNSNWRGPIWFPLNYLLVEALQRYHFFYGDDLKVEYPSHSGQLRTLDEVASDLSRRLCSLFLPGQGGHRPCHGGQPRYATDPHWKDLVLFYEYFHGENGRGCGASHQTGWTSLVTRLQRQVRHS
ncbi:MAG: glucosidase [Verrucomicrobiota bacterium]